MNREIGTGRLFVGGVSRWITTTACDGAEWLTSVSDDESRIVLALETPLSVWATAEIWNPKIRTKANRERRQFRERKLAIEQCWKTKGT